MSQGFKMKLVISCYISSFLLCKAQYRPLYRRQKRRKTGRRWKERGRGEGVDQKKRTVAQLGEVSCLSGLCVMLSALLQWILQIRPWSSGYSRYNIWNICIHQCEFMESIPVLKPNKLLHLLLSTLAAATLKVNIYVKMQVWFKAIH